MIPRSRLNQTFYNTSRPLSKDSVSQPNPVYHPLEVPLSEELLRCSLEDIMQICADRYQLCENSLKKRFDLHELNFYLHSECSNAGKENQKLTMWINKCRGTVRFGMGETINIVIVEMQKLKSMIDAYSQWFQRNVQMYRN
jgi:hypothetical protein